LKLPILLILFNRPTKTRNLVDKLKLLEGHEIFIAADGPRFEDEKIKCSEVREIANELGLQHNLHLKYSDINLGCGLNVFEAINWFFSNVEFGVILEDDINIDLSFFQFCLNVSSQETLPKNVFCISAAAFSDYSLQNKSNHTLSKYPNIWGWSTCRHSVSGYSLDLKGDSNIQIFKVIYRNFKKLKISVYWFIVIKLAQKKILDTWDFQYYYNMWKNNKFALIPSFNFSENIGFDEEGTHVKKRPDFYVGITEKHKIESSINVINISEYNHDYDNYINKYVYKISIFKIIKLSIKYIISKKSKYK
jgi:hypothetical protein